MIRRNLSAGPPNSMLPCASSAVDPWITFPRPSSQARLRLFCFPYAGAGASVFRTWAGLLPPELEVVAVQLPGRESRLREPPLTRLEDLIEALSSVLARYLDRPFAFFGHSLGGLISYELAHRLRLEKGSCPAHLVISGRRPPEVEETDEPLHLLPDSRLIERLRVLNGTRDEVFREPEVLAIVLPILRADFTVCERYRYEKKPPLPCPLTIYGGENDGYVSSSRLHLWSDHTQNNFRVRLFPGNHFFLNSARSLVLQSLAEDLLGEKVC